MLLVMFQGCAIRELIDFNSVMCVCVCVFRRVMS